ncbi:MAG: acetyl-CoA carboxylase biotin carboxylase subunit [Calditrichaeota bacterium]|nr:acetyl-CoA carboxylase biotin carboxylase subunit [Calditrichota bacterium]MCB9391171.1 acetyl-CoA carboxylase biotin carboxylase subunit [Calditrichota bacterium]
MKSILIANRGEIAVRVARTCREMGVKTIAVYSDVDKNSLHVREADHMVALGGETPAESYLDQEKIIRAAKASGAEAIHPGYGFLSENAGFADKVEKSGLIWVGPPASAINAMGSKTEARALMIGANVPVVPGTKGAVKDANEAIEFARSAGFPVLLKAAAGGGGKGMRVVRNEGDLANALAAAQREAKSAFGDDAVYVEKYLEEPKHIEVQIFADKHGNAVYFGERECSMQRRHQKIIEEAPSSAVSPELRAKIGATAVMAAKACGYVNAGTCEFLLDKNGDFYFLEMNTRLQVEHPVTEMVTGLDLVRLQIEVARGKKLPMTQEQIQLRGHAVEVRIYAEEVMGGFLPSTGKLSLWRPSSGPGLREDTGMYEGAEISRFYDPMISKLVAYGETREAATDRMVRALREYRIAGVMTNIGFCRFVLDREEFRSGNFDTGTVERILLPAYREYIEQGEVVPTWLPGVIAAANKVFRTEINLAKSAKGSQQSAWKTAGRRAAMSNHRG